MAFFLVIGLVVIVGIVAAALVIARKRPQGDELLYMQMQHMSYIVAPKNFLLYVRMICTFHPRSVGYFGFLCRSRC